MEIGTSTSRRRPRNHRQDSAPTLRLRTPAARRDGSIRRRHRGYPRPLATIATPSAIASARLGAPSAVVKRIRRNVEDTHDQRAAGEIELAMAGRQEPRSAAIGAERRQPIQALRLIPGVSDRPLRHRRKNHLSRASMLRLNSRAHALPTRTRSARGERMIVDLERGVLGADAPGKK